MSDECKKEGIFAGREYENMILVRDDISKRWY
jgi:hypothetical protein